MIYISELFPIFCYMKILFHLYEFFQTPYEKFSSILINLQIVVNVNVFRAKIYSPSFIPYLHSLISASKKRDKSFKLIGKFCQIVDFLLLNCSKNEDLH